MLPAFFDILAPARTPTVWSVEVSVGELTRIDFPRTSDVSRGFFFFFFFVRSSLLFILPLGWTEIRDGRSFKAPYLFFSFNGFFPPRPAPFLVSLN